MRNALILESSVEAGNPSLAAAPHGPEILPLHSSSADSIISLSCETSSCERDRLGWVWCSNQFSSTEKSSVSHRMTERSTAHIPSHQHCTRTSLGPETSGLPERVGTEKVAKRLVLQEKRLVRAMHHRFTQGWSMQPNI